MPATPITPIITEINEMQTAFKQPSCNSNKPFVEYPSTGNPPVIDFNVPQSTEFVTYGHLVKYFPVSYFKEFCKKVPENNYFELIKNMSAQQAGELFETQTTYGNWAEIDPSFYAAQQGPVTGGPMPPAGSPIATPSGGATRMHVAFTSENEPTALPPHFSHLAGVNGYALGAEKLKVPTITTTKKAQWAANSLRPYDVTRLNGLGPFTKYISRPPQPVPRLIVIEEYTTKSYLGNYGAGKVVKTFSLFPGERTSITMRSYKDRITTVDNSKNVLDSFTDASATSLDTLMQKEQGDVSSTSATAANGGNSFTTTTDSRNSEKSFGIKGSLDLGFISIGGGYGKSIGEASTTAGGMSSTYDYNTTAARMSNVSTLASALNKHVQQSNAVRQVEVNTSTTDVQRSGEEETIIRELQNVNLNNVLNITFRQLQQQYTVLTYLSNLKFAYTNGYAESYTVVDLCNLENMLKDILDTTTDPTVVDTVLCKLLTPYCAVLNYDDIPKQFVEKMTVTGADCQLGITGCTPADESFFRIKSGLKDTYSDGVIDIEVKGVILKVQQQTLQTSSLIADALLGRGDALDCFNQNAQNATNINAYAAAMQAMQSLTANVQATANDQLFADQQLEMGEKRIEAEEKKIAIMDQQMEVVTSITDPLEKATHYKKVFGDCCDVPQSCCGCSGDCNCGGHTETPTV